MWSGVDVDAWWALKKQFYSRATSAAAADLLYLTCSINGGHSPRLAYYSAAAAEIPPLASGARIRKVCAGPATSLETAP